MVYAPVVSADVSPEGDLDLQGSIRHLETEDVRHPQDDTAADVQPWYKVHQLPEQWSGIFVEAISDPTQSSQCSTNTSSFQSFLGLFKDDKTKDIQSPAQGKVVMPVQGQRDGTQSHSHGSGNREDKAAVLAEVGMVPPSAPQKSPLQETGSSADGEAPRGPVGPSDVEITNDKVSFINTMEQNDLPQEDSILDLSGEDGVYRAKPIVIYETDDSLTESQPPENISASTPSSQAFYNPSVEGHNSALLPFVAVGGTGQVNKEHTKDGAISSKFNNASHFPELTKNLESAVTPSLGQTSPRKTNSLSRNSDRSPLRTFGGAEDPEPTNHQVEAHSPERPLSPSKSHCPNLKRQQEEVRRSPSKTCHPSVLPRESTGPQTPRLKGSPLKTFPINIDLQSTIPEEHHGRPTPAPRQKSPFPQAKQTLLANTKNISDISSYPLPSKAEDDSVPYVTSAGHSTAPQPISNTSERSLPCLARACVPQDYQHYLGPHEKAFVPSFHQEKSTFADLSDPTEGVCSGFQVADAHLNPGTTTAWT